MTNSKLTHKKMITKKYSAWGYFEVMKAKRWSDFSTEEKKRMIAANMIIADDLGVVVNEKQIEEWLEEQLPITEPNIGLNYHIDF